MNPITLALDAARYTGGAFTTVRHYAARHLFISGAVVLVVLGGGYYLYSKATAAPTTTRYVLGTVATGTIVASVSVSGQIAASDSIDIKPQVSGTITWVGVKAGQKVSAGQALMSIDDTDAQQTLSDAKKNLAADKLQFQQSSAQAPINYQNDVTALANAKENLSDDYNDTYNDLSGTYLDLPAVVAGSQNTLYGYDFDTNKSVWNMDYLLNLFSNVSALNVKAFHDTSKNDYTTAQAAYDASLEVYKTTTRASDPSQIDTLLTQSISMTTSVAQALQTELNFLGAASDVAQNNSIALPAKFSTVQSSARSYLSTANDDLSKLLADKKTLDNAKQAITSAQQAITLDQVGNPDGSNPISLQVSANSIAKEEEDIAKQESDLADYTVRAPFSGTLSTVTLKVGDTSSGAAATIISQNQVATLSLNEVDAAKISLGQKATLTFDAIDGLTLTGTVAEVDPVGTVSQGVVSYTVQIGLDSQDSRIKPGMTVNAAIQTGVAQDALVVPQSAVKASGAESYVLVFDPALADTGGTAGVVSSVPPAQVPVTTGLSDTTQVQILSGLSAGQQIVVSTRSGAAPTAAAASAARAGATTGATRAGSFGGGGGAATLRGL